MNEDIFLNEKELREAMAPYIVKNIPLDTAEASNLLSQFKSANVKNALKFGLQQALHLKREKATESVNLDYDRLYKLGVERLEASFDPDKAPRPFLLDGDSIVMMRGGGYETAHMNSLDRIISHYEPSSVREIGFGSGKNLIKLASKFPDISFSGYELTEGGVRLAQTLQSLNQLPPNLANWIGAIDTKAKSAIQKIDFLQGSACDLAADDKSVDMTITVLALEQMAPLLPLVLPEIRRTTRKWAVFIEPFRDVQAWHNRFYLASRNYFRYGQDDFLKFKLEPVGMSTLLPRKLTFGAALLVCRITE